MVASPDPTTAPVEAAKLKEMQIALPDWQRLDSVLRSHLPFALWTVGDQPLLYHWLDHAVDQGFEKVTLYCADRPAEVRRAMEGAQLWPIQWVVEAVAQEDQSHRDAIMADRLPDADRPAEEPTDGWSLLRYWYALRKQWFDQMFTGEAEADLRGLAVGRFCSIHPTATLIMPVWIEDYVQVGPGSKIGPYVNIGAGAMIEGPTIVENSVVTAYTYLAGNTELRDCYLEGGLLLNLRHGARVAGVDMVIANSLKPFNPGVPRRERLWAFLLYLLFSIRALFSDSSIAKNWESFDGHQLAEGSGPLWKRRWRWLPLVIRGKLRLFGVLPRTQAQLEALSDEWREIIQRTPPGVFAYSDLYGIHSPDDELEGVHAVFQATNDESVMRSVFKENKWKIFGKT